MQGYNFQTITNDIAVFGQRNLCAIMIHTQSSTFYIQPQIIKHWGYPAEEHKVTTSDGYIVTIHRIPHGKQGKYSDAPRPVVFLQHGLLCSSSVWVTNLPSEALAYILVDAGFDVWMGNARGNTYGLEHESLNPDQNEFWDFR